MIKFGAKIDYKIGRKTQNVYLVIKNGFVYNYEKLAKVPENRIKTAVFAENIGFFAYFGIKKDPIEHIFGSTRSRMASSKIRKMNAF